LALALLVTVALGIGSNVAVHGFARGLVARDSPLTSVDRVVSLFGRDARGEGGPLSSDDFLSVKGHVEAFEWVGAAGESQGAVVVGGRSSIVSVTAVTADLARELNLSLDEGVFLSHRFWRNEFDGKTNVRGEPIRIDGVDVKVGGIAPARLEGLYAGYPIDIWMPLSEESLQGGDGGRMYWVVGRLRRGVSVHQALEAVRPTLSGSSEIVVLPYSGMSPEMTKGMARVGALLDAAALAVFLIACANVASLLLGRASARSRDSSVRVALGSSRSQLAKQLLSDSIVISTAGGAFGLLLAAWTLRILPALLFEQDAEQLVLAPDLSGIVATCVVCVAITIVCGLVPLFEIRQDRPAAVLRRESAGVSKPLRRLRSGLVIAQMTCCCVLVISTGLLLEGFRAALKTSAGKRLGETLLVPVQGNPGLGLKPFEDIERAVQSVAGVSRTAWAGKLPGNRPMWQSLRIEPAGLALRDVTLDAALFTSDSLDQFVLPAKAGRMIGGHYRTPTCPVAIVNEEAAHELFDGDAAGRFVEDRAAGRVEILGVVAMRRMEGATEPSRPTIFYYADEADMASERAGPKRFGVPTVSKLATAVLDTNVVSPNYFDAMGWPLIAGQAFRVDAPSAGCRPAVVNEAAAELYFGGNAVGSAVIDDAGRRAEIIGVVHSPPLGTFQPGMRPAIYFPKAWMAWDHLPRMTLILGVREANDAVLAAVRDKAEAVTGRAPVVVKTLDSFLTQTALAPLHVATVILAVSGATALLLGVLGLYGTLTDSIRQRGRELAVRIALGAQRRHVILLVLGEGGRLAGVGAVAGVLAAVPTSRFLAQIAPMDGSWTLWVWLAGPLVLAGTVAIASVFPARRALTVDPLAITRDDN
jgi:ABC-type lipoprotein release transport system permease subunit